uniref:G_PROTEIN_RECEP_F1_2 domain-containing protein n=1 Tax=Parastrongyloides trichosuri TaxID=131310 RepID=A0A0N4ZL67_PARTI
MLGTPAYFKGSKNEYTNFNSIATFSNVPFTGWKTVGYTTLAIYCGIISISTLLINCLIIYILISHKKGNLKSTDRKLAMYSILLFGSQLIYIVMFYFDLFCDRNANDYSLLYFSAVIRGWNFNIFCLFAPYSLLIFNRDIRSLVLNLLFNTPVDVFVPSTKSNIQQNKKIIIKS